MSFLPFFFPLLSNQVEKEKTNLRKVLPRQRKEEGKERSAVLPKRAGVGRGVERERDGEAPHSVVRRLSIHLARRQQQQLLLQTHTLMFTLD